MEFQRVLNGIWIGFHGRKTRMMIFTARFFCGLGFFYVNDGSWALACSIQPFGSQWTVAKNHHESTRGDYCSCQSIVGSSHNHGLNHYCSWECWLFQWPCSIAMLNDRRVTIESYELWTNKIMCAGAFTISAWEGLAGRIEDLTSHIMLYNP